MNKDELSKKIREHWEKNPFHAYESPYKIGTREFYEYAWRIKETDTEKYSLHLSRFGDCRGKKVLEIGCGTTAYALKRYAENGAVVHGVDISGAAIMSSKKAARIFGFKARLKRADARKLPYKEDMFDFVLALGSLDHSADAEKCINEIYRVLKKGGKTTVSLYYRSILFQRWFFPVTLFFIKHLLRAPSREGMKSAKSPEELMRMLDGDDNPMTRMFTEVQARKLFSRFEIINVEKHEFVMHFMPKWFPRFLHRFLDFAFPLKIFIYARKN